MHKKSSRRRTSSRHRESKRACNSCCSGSLSSHPPTGFYSESSDPSRTSFTYSTSSVSRQIVEQDGNVSEEYNSTDEYHVDFPEVELKLPRRRRHHHSMDRTAVYDKCEGSHMGSSCLYTSPPTDSTDYGSCNSQNRLQSIGSIFSSLFGFFENNPQMTKALLGVVLCYVVVCNIEILVPKVISMIVRLIYPWARYWTVVGEQLFSAIANIFTRLDAVIYASYCEFAAKSCRSRRLMCDVTCSFVDHVLSQSRPHLAPVPQN